MKKVSSLMALFLAAALTACGGNSSQPPATPSAPGTSQPSASTAIDYPTKPIELIVGYAAGGGTHLAAELLSPDAQQYLGQPFNIVCKPGAGGAVGANYVAQAKPDGYTLLYATVSLPTSFALGDIEVLPEEFVGVAQCSSIAPVIAVRADAPYNNAEELIAWCNENPDQFTWTFPGIGSSLHLCGANAINAMGIQDVTVEVPYDGTAEGIAAVLGGHVSAISCFTTSLSEQLKAGEMKLIGVQSPERIPEYPDEPTFLEQGFDASYTSWRGVFAHRDTPPEILDYLNEHLGELINSDSYYERAMTLGEGRAYLDMAGFTEKYLAECESVKTLVEKIGLGG